ncbi:MAG: hypothetical protein IIX38_02995 [Alistipes sp.]|nr:hypothetical protein [Alistipes sp.]
MNGTKIIRITLKSLVTIVLVAISIVISTCFSPIYDFAEPHPFSGPDIYNPYSSLDTTHCWKRANLHTHTRVEGILNECDFSADSTYQIYKSFGYDIIGFTNHNELTKHPIDKRLQMDIYEHGYNALNYHIMTYGAESVWHYDILFPLFASQKQHLLYELSEDADFVQINHPQRIRLFDYADLEKIGGYRLMELTSAEEEIENEFWDVALSAGHYSHGIMNDDLHYPDRPEKIAIRCSFICTPADDYATVRDRLLEGCFYSMSVPNYGDGDWSEKYARNTQLPTIQNIGLRDSTIYIELSAPADSIKFVGSNHRTLHTAYSATSAEYTMLPADPYARIMAFYNDGAVIYSNAFARYDSTTQESPYRGDMYDINTPLTILFNIGVALCLGMMLTLIYITLRR